MKFKRMMSMLFLFLLAGCCVMAGAAEVTQFGIKADGKTDCTDALQKLLDSGKKEIFFPKGSYLFGTVKIPAEVSLKFDDEAKIIPLAQKIAFVEEEVGEGEKRKVIKSNILFSIVGNDVLIEGLHFNFLNGGTAKQPYAIERLIYAKNVRNITLSRANVISPEPAGKKKRGKRTLLYAFQCKDIELKESYGENVTNMIWAQECTNVSSHGNRMIRGGTITTFAFGSQGLRHYDNWSRGVVYQCVFRGGSPDPSRKHPRVPHGTSSIVKRGSKPTDKDFIPHTQGVYDVLIQNNYAEYGVTLCWGNKGRQIVIDGNVARFMKDYTYGVEACENVVFSNNISINSAVCGIMTMYWAEKVLITGNMVIVRHEPYDPELGGKPESWYQGQFVRLHHGPPNKEDTYGAGSVNITGNLFVNELNNRTSGISVENGRDVMISGNKIVNGLIRKHDELTRLKVGGDRTDEFLSSEVYEDNGQKYYDERRITQGQKCSLTIINNEFISRQTGDKPVIILDGTIAEAIIKGNIIRKQSTWKKFTEAQKAIEQDRPRYMLYVVDNFKKRDLTNSTIQDAIHVTPLSALQCILQGNIITGWKRAVFADNTSKDGEATFVITGNMTDGAIEIGNSNSSKTKKVVNNNLDLSAEK